MADYLKIRGPKGEGMVYHLRKFAHSSSFAFFFTCLSYASNEFPGQLQARKKHQAMFDLMLRTCLPVVLKFCQIQKKDRSHVTPILFLYSIWQFYCRALSQRLQATFCDILRHQPTLLMNNLSNFRAPFTIFLQS